MKADTRPFEMPAESHLQGYTELMSGKGIFGVRGHFLTEVWWMIRDVFRTMDSERLNLKVDLTDAQLNFPDENAPDALKTGYMANESGTWFGGGAYTCHFESILSFHTLAHIGELNNDRVVNLIEREEYEFPLHTSPLKHIGLLFVKPNGSAVDARMAAPRDRSRDSRQLENCFFLRESTALLREFISRPELTC